MKCECCKIRVPLEREENARRKIENDKRRRYNDSQRFMGSHTRLLPLFDTKVREATAIIRTFCVCSRCYELIRRDNLKLALAGQEIPKELKVNIPSWNG